ncbi:AAA family ATPase [Saprospira grandis]|uniref:AAA family ATPase n=1 Tax=Saprospira grandis TaxID=1008 RepID=UPI0022DD3646|nr:AAA family ATPase [Saprospira grandis]WBM74152.1 ATP-binding protein [Saprospira grandis]
MFLKRLKIPDFKVLQNIDIEYERHDGRPTYPVISLNGGGKSTLLQFIFTMLHCSFDAERQFAVQNLLEGYEPKGAVGEKQLFAQFVLEIERDGVKEDMELNFWVEPIVKGVIQRAMTVEEVKELKEAHEALLILTDLKSLGISGFLAIPQPQIIQALQDLAITDFEKQLALHIEKNISNPEAIWENFLNFCTLTFKHLNFRNEKELNYDISILNDISYAIGNTINFNSEITYILPNLILSYDYNYDYWNPTSISNKIYLAGPRTQVFQFLDKKAYELLFEQIEGKSYEQEIQEVKKKLPNFFTYEFASSQMILDLFKAARDNDFKKALETGEYGNQLNLTKNSLHDFLRGKSISIDGDITKVIFNDLISGKEFKARDFSHGELKKLSIFVWLRHLVPKGSLVLMDEIDIGLHPKWQYEITEELKEWGGENQYLLATHSPQIIGAAHYKNLVVLDRIDEGNHSTARQFKQPLVDVDLNTIVERIMGAQYTPQAVLDLHKKYRKLVEEAKEETPEGKKLKAQILEYESEQSSFLQEMKFFIQFRD